MRHVARTRGLTGVPRGGTGGLMGGIVTGTGVFMGLVCHRGEGFVKCWLPLNDDDDDDKAGGGGLSLSLILI